MPQSCLEYLAQRHDFLVHGVMRRRFATRSPGFFKPVNTIFVDFASRDLGKHHGTEKRDQMTIGTRVLSARIGRTPFSLRDDVEFAQVQLSRFAEKFSLFSSPSRSFPRNCKYQSSATSFAFERLSYSWSCVDSFRLESSRTAS